MRINGYNEEMHYGGQDREFGERLFNLGIKSKQICYSAIVLHLDHKRPYKTKESMDKNKAIRRNTRKSGIIETPNGIKQRHWFFVYRERRGIYNRFSSCFLPFYSKKFPL